MLGFISNIALRIGVEMSLSSFILDSSQPRHSQDINVDKIHVSKLVLFPKTISNGKLKIQMRVSLKEGFREHVNEHLLCKLTGWLFTWITGKILDHQPYFEEVY